MDLPFSFLLEDQNLETECLIFLNIRLFNMSYEQSLKSWKQLMEKLYKRIKKKFNKGDLTTLINLIMNQLYNQYQNTDLKI